MSSFNASVEASQAAAYANENVSLMKTRLRVKDACNDLCAKYADILTNSEICKAKMLCWDCLNPGEFANKFLVLVLMEGYRVFDSSHVRYPKILAAVKRENPRWVNRYINEHEFKLKRCKVSIYPIDNEVVESK